MFKWYGIVSSIMPMETQINFDFYKQAYHHMMIEFVLL